MTPQEQQLLEDFLQRLVSAGGVAKDPQADALIRQRLAGQPDALYLLVQRSLLQQQALENAKAQIAQLQSQAGSQQSVGSFLGGQQPAWNAAPPPYPPQAPAASPSWRERLFGGAPAQPPAAPSFLSQAATTAAGVAGGMFLFEGIESLMGGHHGGGFLGGGGGQPTVIENITENNNYYDDNNDRSLDHNDRDFASTDDFNDSTDGGFDDSDWS
ncbi:ABC transporter substrate-binding protein [Dyella jiangningensis]|nr:ABC transporter substrate-binding protein [Dyella jiangningensis]